MPASATASPAPPTPTPAFRLEADGPHGCPLVANGWIIITQGYGEGTHAPAATWGALDLGVDGDGDGAADPWATDGQLVVATHAGVARVYPMSWPGGNFVLVEDAQSGWSTAYAHLAIIDVADGQFVEAGTMLGTVGSTGQATGPHLHYEVRYGGVNLDPSGLVTCWG
jgi:murein DD-endopeptidase MepM/ murein hydrolase activator NlpD